MFVCLLLLFPVLCQPTIIRSKDLQRDFSRNFTPKTLMKAKMVDKKWIGVGEIYNKLTPMAGLFEHKETKEIIFETKENSLNEIQLAQKIKFEFEEHDRTKDFQNLIQERNWNEMFSRQIVTSTRHGRDFQKALIELVDVHTREVVSGRTPLYLAVIWERIDLMEMFLKQGANIDEIDNKKQTPLLRAILCGKRFGTIDFLLTHGANPNFRDANSLGRTVLYHLAERSDIPLIELFLQHGASINETCTSGTPLIFAFAACKKKYINADVAEFLLSRGANPNLKDELGKTLLHRAAETNNITLIENLLKHGAKINEINNYHMSPLMYAARKGSCEAVECLLRRRADPNIVNSLGNNAYDLCRKYAQDHKCTIKCAFKLRFAENISQKFRKRNHRIRILCLLLIAYFIFYYLYFKYFNYFA